MASSRASARTLQKRETRKHRNDAEYVNKKSSAGRQAAGILSPTERVLLQALREHPEWAEDLGVRVKP
jgi:hypothetical protein